MGQRDERRILVVEDDKELCDLLTELFKGEGYEVRCVEDGGRALVVMHTWRPGIVILDLKLKLIHGDEVLKLMPMYIDPKQLKVVVLTGDSKTEPKELPGASLIFPKPFDTGELLKRVKAL